jgi:hypothetical protein
MTDEELKKIRACKALLPEPGPEVVGKLLDEVDRQRNVILDLKRRLAVCVAERKVVERHARRKGETET